MTQVRDHDGGRSADSFATTPAAMGALRDHGYAVAPVGCPEELRDRLREAVFAPGVAGARCLLDREVVREAAVWLRGQCQRLGVLGPDAVAVQAIAFDKSPSTNWKVAWHQDLMFPFADTVSAPGYALPGEKEGVPYARPPQSVLESMLAVRLHLDRCDEVNGPLRVSPGTHLLGVLPSTRVLEAVAEYGQVTCLAGEGDAVLMRPLTLHASSLAVRPSHRRVLHVVFHSGAPMAEPWHRAV